MRGLAAHVADLRAAAGVLQARCGLRPGQLTPTEADDTGGQRRSRVGGGAPVDGGGWETVVAHPQPPRRRAQLRIKTPAALAAQLGTHLTIAAPVRFHHRGDEWAARVAARQAVRYDISYDPERDRWYLDASWANTPEPSTSLEELRAGPVLGVDLNADHLACCLLDASGNPVGDPTTIEVHTEGLAASRRDGRVRAAITALLDHAQHAGCGAVVVENLDFGDARATGRETLGRRRAGNGCAAPSLASPPGDSVPGSPVWRPGAASRSSGWTRPTPAAGATSTGPHRCSNRLPTRPPVTRHHAAAAAIGRRGLGLAIRRRPAGPRTGQRTAAGTPPSRPDRHRGYGGRRDSSGPPTHPP